MTTLRPTDHVSARHDGRVLIGTVLEISHTRGTFDLITSSGVATGIPLDSIVAVEPVAIVVARARRTDPAYPDEVPVTEGLSVGEWASLAGVLALAAAVGAAVAGGLLGLGWLATRWLP